MYKAVREMTGTLTVENRGKARCLKNEARKRLLAGGKIHYIGCREGCGRLCGRTAPKGRISQSL